MHLRLHQRTMTTGLSNNLAATSS